MLDYNKLPPAMKKIIGAVAVLFGLFLIFAGLNQIILAWNNFRNGGITIASQTASFDGEGKVSVAPDTAKVVAGLVTEGKDSISVQTENSGKINKVVDYLKKEGIAGGDIKTSNYNLSPKYEYTKGQSKLVGYVLNQSVEITIRDLTQTGKILDGVVNNGANEINSVSLFVDKPEDLKNKAREAAIKQAKEKAAAAAKAAGFGLGRIVGFSENTVGQPPIYYQSMVKGGGGIAASAAAPQIQPGSQEITIDIVLTYLIK